MVVKELVNHPLALLLALPLVATANVQQDINGHMFPVHQLLQVPQVAIHAIVQVDKFGLTIIV